MAGSDERPHAELIAPQHGGAVLSLRSGDIEWLRALPVTFSPDAPRIVAPLDGEVIAEPLERCGTPPAEPHPRRRIRSLTARAFHLMDR